MSDPVSTGRPVQILVVCRANVCRSPFAAEILGQHLRAAAVPAVIVLSAGIHADVTSGQCIVAAADLRSRKPVSSYLEDHVPTAATEDLILSSDLILTMGESHRSAVIAMSSAVRNRTFTLIEARIFAQTAVEAGFSASSPAGWSEVLNDRRGRVRLPIRGTRRHGTTGISIEDGHSSSNRVHKRALATVDRESAALANALIRL